MRQTKKKCTCTYKNTHSITKRQNRKIKIEVFRYFPRTSRSHVASAFASGLQFEVYVCTARPGSRGKGFTARVFVLPAAEGGVEIIGMHQRQTQIWRTATNLCLYFFPSRIATKQIRFGGGEVVSVSLFRILNICTPKYQNPKFDRKHYFQNLFLLLTMESVFIETKTISQLKFKSQIWADG